MQEVELVLAVRIFVVDLQHVSRRPAGPRELMQEARAGAAATSGRSWAWPGDRARRQGARDHRALQQEELRLDAHHQPAASRRQARELPLAAPGAGRRRRVGRRRNRRRSGAPRPATRAAAGRRRRRHGRSTRSAARCGAGRCRRCWARRSLLRRSAPRPAGAAARSLPLATPSQVGELHEQRVHAARAQIIGQLHSARQQGRAQDAQRLVEDRRRKSSAGTGSAARCR
jgi:hypothetical protein